MSTEEIVEILRKSFEEDRKKDPREAFYQMVADGRIDADGKPIWRDKSEVIFVGRYPPNTDE